MKNLPVHAHHADRAHARLGASGAYRWMTCAGSIPLAELVPREDEDSRSIYARTGTCAHEVLELALRHDVDPAIYIGTEHDGIVVDKEMVDYLRPLLAKVKQLCELEGVDAPFVEVQFSLERLDPPEPMFGTADIVIAGKRHLIVLDLKYGAGIVVEAIANPQLMFYALGAALELDRVFDTVTVGVFQPRAEHEAGPLRLWTFSWDRLVEFRHEVIAAAHRAHNSAGEREDLVTGSHCRFCRAAPICPALKTEAEDAVREKFANLPVAAPKKAELEEQVAQLPAPEHLSIEELVEIHQKGDLFRRWLDNVDRFIYAELVERGKQMPGLKAVRKYGNRAWADEAAVVAALEAHGLDRPDALYDTVMISPAEAERRLREANDELTLAEAKEIVAPLVLRPERGYSVVEEADKRPAASLATGVQDAFAAVSTPDEGDEE